MPRPSNPTAEAARQRILEQATRLFSENGVGETSIREIARAAEVSLAMVHHYFDSKDGLLKACIASVYSDLAALPNEVQRVMESATSAEDLLRKVTITEFRFVHARRGLIRLLLRVAIQRGMVGRDATAALNALMNMVSDRLAAMTGRSPAEYRIQLRSVMLLIDQYAVNSGGVMDSDVVQTERPPIEVLEENLVKTVLQMFGLPSGQPLADSGRH
jgi:AcrR family transcriptional regulator